MSSLIFPAMVTRPDFVGCLYCLWLPFVRTILHPSWSKIFMISRIFTNQCNINLFFVQCFFEYSSQWHWIPHPVVLSPVMSIRCTEYHLRAYPHRSPRRTRLPRKTVPGEESLSLEKKTSCQDALPVEFYFQIMSSIIAYLIDDGSPPQVSGFIPAEPRLAANTNSNKALRHHRACPRGAMTGSAFCTL